MIPGYLAGAIRDRPQIGGYAYRARRFPLAEQALARAMAEHGTKAVPTCLHCGGRIRYPSGHEGHGFTAARCEQCGQPPS